jgi:hypothetical protein
MRRHRSVSLLLLICFCSAFAITEFRAGAQEAPPASAARILLLPRRMVSGDRSTLAVLDFEGRLTPGVTVQFSNGDRVKTDATGRALYVAPLTPGQLYASIADRPGRVKTTVVSEQQAAAEGIEVSLAPRLASLSDWFTIYGGGFCGDADKNTVVMGGEKALVLASSPLSLIVLPPTELLPGPAKIEVSCGNQIVGDFSTVFLSLELEADNSPLAPGQQRTMAVRVKGTEGRVPLEARNLAPEVAELSGGNPVMLFTSGGVDNTARFELIGKSHGRILVSIRLRPTYSRPRH